MHNELNEERSYLQGFADSIAEATGFDAHIEDDWLRRIAGTGLFRESVSLRMPPGCAADEILKTRMALLIFDPLQNPVCAKCPMGRTGDCYREYAIYTPIVSREYVIGCFALAAVTDEKKAQLKRKSREWLRFAEQCCASLADHIERNRLERQLNLMNNLTGDGVVITDAQGRILSQNRVARDWFGNAANLPEAVGDDSGDFGTWYRALPDGEHELRLHTASAEIRVFVKSRLFADYDPDSWILFVFKQKKDLNALAMRLLRTEPEVSDAAAGDESRVIGVGAAVQNAKKLAKQAARYTSNVLLVGESGVGKEVFARYIHEQSDRRNRPFVTINCAAIPENLLESELFGYESGAFTDAKREGKPGMFEIANEGILFLDEIGEMPLHLQPKLLRVLEEKKLTRIGGVESVALDIRIIAATNCDLEEMVENGRFRKDLFYRLCVFPIALPPLRDRPEDIPVLADWFLKRYSKRFGKRILRMDEHVKRCFLLYSWPGNVRELENVIERAVILSEGGQIEPLHLPPSLQTPVLSELTAIGALDARLAVAEYDMIVDALKRCHGNTTQTAAHLGLTRRILGLRMAKYKLNYKTYRSS
jgi:transcriptional regulator with PAS, ATPase and Fis domain